MQITLLSYLFKLNPFRIHFIDKFPAHENSFMCRFYIQVVLLITPMADQQKKYYLI